ncbi:MAG TPA: hypothetical protein VG389_22650 [Myxococcota bacterium]|jgi:hypothetical protein|nr:hypothetical protein [Myxococcota bacterium]
MDLAATDDLVSRANDYLVVVYAVYALASVVLTVWLARTLFKNGAVFLEDVFADNPALAGAVNRLLVVGFYLLNLGYASLMLRGGFPESMREAIELLSQKLGLLLLSLGVVHFGNMFLFHRIRRRARQTVLPPPVAPQMMFGSELK